VNENPDCALKDVVWPFFKKTKIISFEFYKVNPMTQNSTFLDILNLFWFAALPYLAIAVFVVISIQRYAKRGFSYSSLASQFLENKMHFWGLVPFHYGLITVLTAHLLFFLIPKQILLWNNEPLRLYLLEVFIFIGGVFTLIGLINIVIRRSTDARSKIVTSFADWAILAILAFQIVAGLYVAIFNSWGSHWFATSLSPYLWSLVKFNPEISYVAAMPLMVKLHIINAFLILLLFPFTRLVHLLVVPLPYLWRKPQMVRWYWNKKTIRTPEFRG